MNDWSFGQLCRLAGVAKDTVNRLRPETACQVFSETLPRSNRPLQLFTQGDLIRSIHGTGYTRLHDADVVEMLRDAAVDFEPPQKAFNGATGLYAGEQDLFCFLIDPLGWTEIEGEAFAPGFFVWNSRGRKPVVRRADLLAPSGVPEPHRVGCRRSRRVFPQAHGQRHRVARRDAAAGGGPRAKAG